MSTKVQNRLDALSASVLVSLLETPKQTARELGIKYADVQLLTAEGLIKVTAQRKHTVNGEASRGRPFSEFRNTDKGRKRAKRLAAA